MKAGLRARTKIKMPAASPRRLVKRFDGARHWPKTLDQFVWLLLRAGITPEQLTRAISTSLVKHRKTRGLVMPTPEVLEYGRVLTYWQNEPAYLDERGRPRSLTLSGRSASFASLVRQSVPHAHASEVLAVLSRHGLVSNPHNGRVRMLSTVFLPRRRQRAQVLAYTLSSLEGFIDNCYSNLRNKGPQKLIGQLQRTTWAERFDMTRLAEYDAFLRDSAQAFMGKHDAWLKRREIKHMAAPHGQIGYVGVGVFGLKAR